MRPLEWGANLVVQALSAYGARKLRIQRRPAFPWARVTTAEAQATIERFGLSWHRFQSEHGHEDLYQSAHVLDDPRAATRNRPDPEG